MEQLQQLIEKYEARIITVQAEIDFDNEAQYTEAIDSLDAELETLQEVIIDLKEVLIEC